MKYIPFDSRDKRYKSVTGAAKEGESVRFSVLLHNDASPYMVYMAVTNCTHMYRAHTKFYTLNYSGKYDDNYNWYTIELSLKEGIYNYFFCYDSPWGRLYITRFRIGEGHVSPEGKEWQLTVVQKDFSTPLDFSGGIIYQIFPDRFYNSGKLKKNVPNDRYLQEDWYAIPEYRQTKNIKRLCNDYYGGDLAGITEKIPYLKSLGVSIIYLNPIFEAHSNHRYNTADYFEIDPMLGTKADFKKLCATAKKNGISIILDGVFSHTGDDSVYFNRYGRYDSVGAYNSVESPYKNWYKFNEWPNDYSAWWGVPSLPEVEESTEDYLDFITGENGVLRYWMRMGASGWRLDVADELPDVFLDKTRSAVRAENPKAIIIGEVWEDATNKVSYSERRRYLRGSQLDSVMNYPFSNAIINFVKGGNAFDFMDSVIEICDNYPKQCLDLMMNHIGTHDTIRAVTALAGAPWRNDRAWQSTYKMTEEQLEHGKQLLRLAAVLQFTLPGIPSIFYGDEAGVQGYGDPFCRTAYPWGREDQTLIEFYKKLGNFRRENAVFKNGDIVPVFSGLGALVYKRVSESEEVLVCVNRWHDEEEVFVGDEWDNSEVVFGQAPTDGKLLIEGTGYIVLKRTIK